MLTRRIGIMTALACLPAGAALSDEPFYLVAASDSIQRYDLDGNYLGDLIPSGSDLISASQMALSPDGSTLYIGTFQAASNVSIFDANDGTYLGNLHDGGPIAGPSVIAYSHAGTMLVSDFVGGNVYEYDLDTLAPMGAFFDSANLINPHEIIAIDDGYLVSDYGSNRVFKFNLDGTFDSNFLTNREGISRPLDMLLTEDKQTLYVSNNASGRVTVYDMQTRTLLNTIGPGQLTFPEGLEFAPDGSLVVANAGQGNLKRFDINTGALLDTFELIPGVTQGSTDVHLVTPADCLADVNGDGMVTPTDFTAWIAAFNSSAPECDQNSDGSCTPTDFTAWIANFNAGCA